MTIQTFLYAKRNSCVNFWELTYEWPSYLHGLKKWVFLCLLGMQLKEINKNTQMYLKRNFHVFRIVILQIFRRIQIFI